jgi:DNA-binding CsgD family transcriptional regulator
VKVRGGFHFALSHGMKHLCPYCCPLMSSLSHSRKRTFRKVGFFKRKSDRKKVPRFFCLICLKYFSQSSSSKNYYQKKRNLNHRIVRLLVAGVSQREAARILNVNRKTVVRKFIFMGERAKEKLKATNKRHPVSRLIQFDDMETFEHTKCKPLSITLAVEEKTRRILGFEVSQMPAKGRLAHISRKKYGIRKDHRPEGRKKLFQTLKALIHENSQIKSDENPHYPKDVKRHFPKAQHLTFKGKRGAVVGQGELKKIGFDPLFWLNHTCAVLRERVNRLKRRTWSTTKKPERLSLHLALVALHHNLTLPPLKNAI